MFKFPYYAFMSPAEEGADLSGADRGDDFDPALFVDDDSDKSKPAAAASQEEAKDDKPGDDKPGDDESKLGDDKSTDKPEDKAKAKPVDKEDRKPSRAEKRVQQLLERTAALEKQLAAKTGSDATAKTLADLETEATRLETEYHKALGEDPTKAATLLSQIRQIDRAIARVEAAAEAEATINEKLESRDLASAIDEITEKYPQLAKGSEEFDQELVTEINAVFQGLIPISSNKAAAMRRAVKMVMGESERAPAGLGEEIKGDKTREERAEEGRKRTVDTINRQPPNLSTSGKGGPAASIGAIKTMKDLEAASEADLAKARGDEVA